jgi:signal transduction histidine kinase
MGDEIDEEFLEKYIEKNNKIIKFMSQTIDDFRNFFRIDKEKINFHIKQATQSVIDMQSSQLKKYNIKLTIRGEEFEICGFQSEYQQVILNIINNAKDALNQNNNNNSTIDIDISSKCKTISIKDNAGGIDQNIINRIFEPYFTTKEQGKGTGMGLYMSKMIIKDNMDGDITAKNTKDGVCFIIDFKIH